MPGAAGAVGSNAEAEALGGDKGYDCDALVDAIEACGMAVVIPPKANRTPRMRLGRL